MEELSKSELIERIPKENCVLVIIENNLTENAHKVEDIINNLDNEIDETFGYCFFRNIKKYYYWEYVPLKNRYLFNENEIKGEFFLHEKLESKLGIKKIPENNKGA